MKLHRLSNKEQLDIRSMRYFIPRRNVTGWRIRGYDQVKMADLSSRGIKPQCSSKGFELLKHGKTYREYQIASWRDGIREGIITEYEILSGLPEWLRPSITESLRGAFMDDGGLAYRTAANRSLVKMQELLG